MKVQIFTCRFGSGHMKGAKHLKDCWENQDVEIIDIIEELFPEKANFIYKTYASWARQARYLNKMVTGSGNHNLAYHFLDPIRYRFCQFMEGRDKADIYVATYSAAAHLLNYYKEKTKDPTPLIIMITDFTPHEGWIQRTTKAYLVASDYTKKIMVQRGISDSAIYLYGWPREEITHPKRLGKLHILVAGGGLGLLPEDEKFYTGLRDQNQAEIRVLCGENKKLYEKLKRKNLKDIEAYPYLPSLKDHFLWADLCVTKPGGMSILDALNWETPICYIKPYLSQEVRNAKYLEAIGGGFLLTKSMAPIRRKDLVPYRLNLRKNRISQMPSLSNLLYEPRPSLWPPKRRGEFFPYLTQADSNY